MERRKLGKTDIEVTPVGMGTLNMGFSQKDLGFEEGADVILYALERGINFLDTAQYYRTYPFLRRALDTWKEKGGEPPVICSRSLTEDYDDMIDAVYQAMGELDLPFIDIFLLHEVNSRADFKQREGAWKALKEMKAAGKVRAIGVSTHHIDVTMAMSQREDCDVVFCLTNKDSLGIRKGEEPGTCEEMARAIKYCSLKGIGVFTMKAFGGGNLTGDYINCLNYASRVEGSQSVMIGMVNREEVDAAVDYFEGKLDPDYQPDVSKKRMIIEQTDCLGCGRCKKRCSNGAIHWNDNGLAEIDQHKCLRCGYCAPVCPVRAIILM